MPYGGAAVCYIEMGGDTIGKVDVNFLSAPAPTARFTPLSVALADAHRPLMPTTIQLEP